MRIAKWVPAVESLKLNDETKPHVADELAGAEIGEKTKTERESTSALARTLARVCATRGPRSCALKKRKKERKKKELTPRAPRENERRAADGTERGTERRFYVGLSEKVTEKKKRNKKHRSETAPHRTALRAGREDRPTKIGCR